MDCKCGGGEMKCVDVWDDPYGDAGPYAWNLYTCDCGIIAKENVWKHKGVVWIGLANDIEVINV